MKKKIEHIILTGGGSNGFITYGVLRELRKQDFWNPKDIKTMFCTSAGAYMGIIMSLNINWSTLDRFFINRPWEKMFDINPDDIFSAFQRKGILQSNFIEKALMPILNYKNISKDITLIEFYNITKIELHMFTIDLNSSVFETVDLSYKTQPNMKLLHAVTATTAVPILLPPLCIDNHCYIDGGIIDNLPINHCIKTVNPDLDTILVIKTKYSSRNTVKINNDSTALQFLLTFINRITFYLNSERKQQNIPNTVYCANGKYKGFKKWIKEASKKKNRKQLVNKGIDGAKTFLYYKNNLA